MAVAAIGARKSMDWGFLNGAGITAVIAAVAGFLIRNREKKADEQKTKLETNVAWNTQILLDGEKQRAHQAERIAVLEHRAEESAEKIYELESKLLAEKRTVDRLMTENDNLRKMNDDLRGEVTRLVGELQEERARNREWEQKIIALQEGQKGT